MAFYFDYDSCTCMHRIAAYEVINEKDELLGYRPVVHKVPKGGIVVEKISDRYPALHWKVFSDKQLAIDFAVNFFKNLPRPKAY